MKIENSREAEKYMTYSRSIIRIVGGWWRYCIHLRIDHPEYPQDFSLPHNSDSRGKELRKKEDVWDVYSGGVARVLRYSPTERVRTKGGEQDQQQPTRNCWGIGNVPSICPITSI